MRWRLFQSTRVEVDSLLGDLKRQGSAQARVAHVFSTLLVVLFSLASLVALASDALSAVVTQWTTSHSLNIPSAITVLISTLVVLCFDVGMVYAASMLRILSSRRAGVGEYWIHVGIMIAVAILEASTYAYMAFRWESVPTTAAAALIIARALAAPVLSIYLSMSRPLPVVARDILSSVEYVAGGGVLRDVLAVATDKEVSLANLERKLHLYRASAVMTPADRTRLDGMIAAVMQNGSSVGHYTHAQEGAQSADTGQSTITPLGSLEPSESPPDKPPTGPGSPSISGVRTGQDVPEKTKTPATMRLVSDRQRRIAARGSNRSRVRGRHPVVNHEEIARAAWAQGARSVEKMRRATGMSKSTAGGWCRALKIEQAGAQQQTAQ